MARFFCRELPRLISPNILPSIIWKVHDFPSFSTSSAEFFPSREFFLFRRALDLLELCERETHLFQIQAHLITTGMFQVQSPSFASRVLKLSAGFCGIDYTLLTFRSIEFPDTFCVNVVIDAYSCSAEPPQALIFYFERLKNGFFPNSFTFPPIFSFCAKMACLRSGVKCHGQVVKHGVDHVLAVQNSLIHVYARCGLMGVAKQVFDEMHVRDLVSWNSIVDGFARNGSLDMAHKVFDEMRSKNIVSWNALMTGYLNGGNPGCALKLFREMVGIGLMGNDTTMVCVLTACGRSARLKEGRSVHGFLIKEFLNLSVIVNTALIDMYGKCARTVVAQAIFDRMPFRNLVCWNAMILGHCIHGNSRDGLNLYSEMVGGTVADCEETGIEKHEKPKREQAIILPDEITFVGVLCACAREKLLLEGRNYFSKMIEVFHVRPNFAHYWCMANLLASVGLMREAVEILRNMPVDEDISSVAAMLGSCRFLGEVISGEEFAKALTERYPLSFLHYTLLLNVYAVSGQWEKAASIREIMCEKGFKRIPTSRLTDLKEMIHNLKVGTMQQMDSQKVNDSRFTQGSQFVNACVFDLCSSSKLRAHTSRE